MAGAAAVNTALTSLSFAILATDSGPESSSSFLLVAPKAGHTESELFRTYMVPMVAFAPHLVQIIGVQRNAAKFSRHALW